MDKSQLSTFLKTLWGDIFVMQDHAMVISGAEEVILTSEHVLVLI